MTLTPEQYSEIAKGYAEAAADPLIADEKKQEFARKAEWFHFLAQREKGALASERNSRFAADFAGEQTSGGRPFRPLLTTLWLTGAALYLISTLLLTNAVNLFGENGGQPPVGNVSRPVERPSQTATIEDKEGPGDHHRQIGAAADRPHAISPEQPAYEAPGLTVPPAAEQEETTSLAPEPGQEASVPAATFEAPVSEVLKTTAAANIRDGPSTRSKVIGTATLGAELQVKARENGWIQFVDPSSGNGGWIHSSLVAPASPQDASRLVETPSEEASSPATRKVKPAKRVKQKPSVAPPQHAQERPSRPSPADREPVYADFPNDEDFLPDRSRKGFFARRRMLREGLMSPGFLPPQ
jgi:uncharacterized protein YraI